MKKIGALVLAVVMMMTVTAFAASTTNEGALNNSNTYTNNTLSAITSQTFTKEIVVLNSTSSNVWEPNIEYIYAITPVTGLSNVIITDGHSPDPVKAVVKDGKDGGLLISSATTATAGSSAKVVFGDDTASATESSPLTTTDFSSAKKISETLTLSFDVSKFVDSANVPLPGVYRYKISESVTGTNTAAQAGVTEGTYSADRFVDVYVRWTSAERTALEVYAVTMFTANDSITYDSSSTNDALKVTGYDVATEGNNADVYKTYNITVQKAVDGTMADKNHQFPFTIALSESAATAVEFYATGDSYTNADLTFSDGAWTVNGSYGSDLKLKNGQKINLIGLPLTTTATVGEKDDTIDFYTATAADVNNESLNLTNDATAKTWVTETNAVVIGSTTGSETNTVTFTNILTEISPTGVVLRVAPYVLILAAGIVLLLISKKRRAVKEEE